jgi:MinD-like ATPase involved in chromosome partitioning or flagellar assembly
MAMTGRRVLLVDADLRRPQLHGRLMYQISGLSEVLDGDARPSEAMSESSTGVSHHAGRARVTNAADMLDNERLAADSRLQTSLRRRCDRFSSGNGCIRCLNHRECSSMGRFRGWVRNDE